MSPPQLWERIPVVLYPWPDLQRDNLKQFTQNCKAEGVSGCS